MLVRVALSRIGPWIVAAAVFGLLMSLLSRDGFQLSEALIAGFVWALALGAVAYVRSQWRQTSVKDQ